jgi:copper transport protein
VLVELFFSEPIEGNFSKIEVLDSAGNRVDNDDARVDANNPLRMTVTVRSLKDGIYTISWKTLSLVDSHITAGAYPFAVGDVDAAALENAAAASQQISLSFGEVLFRWLSYISGAMLSGGILFVLLVWRPAFQAGFRAADRPQVDLPWRRLAAFGLLILLVANLLGLLFQTGQVVDQEIAAPWNPAITRLLFATRYGVLWLIRFVLALVCARFLLRPKSDRDTWLSFAALMGILLTFSLNSHAAAEPQWLLPIGADWLHLVAASFWVGGLVYFVAALRAIRPLPDPQRVGLTARLIPNFTRLALTSVGLLTLTGIYSAVLRIGAWQALTGTLYGRILIVKTLLALPMIMLGAINFLSTTPNMKKAAESPAGGTSLVERFRTLVSAEVILGAAVLLVVGIFTAIPPARAIATETTLADRAREEDLVIDMEISPGNVGLNMFAVMLEEGGQPVEGAREVSLQFIPTTVDLPASEVVLEEQGEGRYAAEGAFLSLPDNWQVQVSIRRQGQFDVFANFEFPVGTSAAQNFPWNRLAAVLLLVGAVLYLLAVGRMPQPEEQRLFLTRLPALSLLVISVFVFLLPTGLEERYINPVPPNQSSVAAGEAIYRVQCIACHGPGGRGDGPVGLTLNPPPADLYEHTQPGVHPDGQLYEWITFGFADNQVMPRFKDILSDEDRWNVVNYIRTFSREAGEASQ